MTVFTVTHSEFQVVGETCHAASLNLQNLIHQTNMVARDREYFLNFFIVFF